ncbi:uncharacterized protein [Physcomitrium patens]|uniref:Uncharacterized protein n=1 Tax=Physcomitrium patens TaxID=3218 RepID=A0A7I4BG96_PHYPA|nr:uncharacterized protein LOC112295537 isoform X1 [Physcomitrium patens]XP_024403048.1 uncharacterized protein LOC112295537 isoform X1 [Physcomitrium patens]XP_024403049.1 uncharacterized protein LOC112295537 isoform X1 [Physcomitrium patens]XP_024403050.1 uncharacterized protein LOC112295537 isoform X1 [Physcomitrium patens]XP_024403051.1 uncharacterized protein LOC112295537 isoform X1 [Physcomitrium patens]|eukprot:XP_024403047.1 uncharacterized protein LOC112295537 isoform X1 [Physcomitrella patens]
MGEFGSFSKNLDEENVKHVVNEERSWLRITSTHEVAVDAPEDEYYTGGPNFESEHSAYSYRKKEVRIERPTGPQYSHRRVRSASGGHRDVLFVDGAASSEEDEYIKVDAGPKLKAQKGVRRQYDHLRQESLDAYSDPGYGNCNDDPGLALKSHSIDRVSNWLQDTSLGRDTQNFENPQNAFGQPSKRLTPRRPHPRTHVAAMYSSPRSETDGVYYEPHETSTRGSQRNGMVQRDLFVDQYSSNAQDNEDSKVAIHNISGFKTLSPGSIYRGPGDQRPLSSKAFDFVKKGAEGIASVSRTAAVEIAKVSRTTSKQVKDKSVELKHLAAPVLGPLFQAVIDESREQLKEIGGEREHIQREAPTSADLERMATPYVQLIGKHRGRGVGLGPTPQRQTQQPAVGGAHRPAMRPMASGRAGSMPPQVGVSPMGGVHRPAMRPMASGRAGSMPPQVGVPRMGGAHRPAMRPMASGRAGGMPPEVGFPPMGRAHRPAMRPMASGRAGGMPPEVGVSPMGVSAPWD